MKPIWFVGLSMGWFSTLWAQSDLEKTLKAGELLINGVGFFKGTSNDKKPNLCVKNKMSDKVTYKLSGKDAEGTDFKKELVIPKEGKECFYNVPHGILLYEVVLPNRETFKKGEFDFSDDATITLKD